MGQNSVKEENYEKILVAATELFCKYGAEKMTLRMVAEKAEVSYRCVIRHFETKDNLILCIVNTGVKKLEESLRALIITDEFQKADGKQQLIRIVDHYLHMAVNAASYYLSLEEMKVTEMRMKNAVAVSERKQGTIVIEETLINAWNKGIIDLSIREEQMDINRFKTFILSLHGFFYSLAETVVVEDLKEIYDVEDSINNYKNFVIRML